MSALVREYLLGLAHPTKAPVGASEAERRARGIREVVEEITADGGGLRMADNLSREELYDRRRASAEARETGAAPSEKIERG